MHERGESVATIARSQCQESRSDRLQLAVLRCRGCGAPGHAIASRDSENTIFIKYSSILVENLFIIGFVLKRFNICFYALSRQ
jgi:hypothetical protein